MQKLVEDFCTPPVVSVTDSDRKIISDAEKIEIEFEDGILDCYCWGKGKTIILTHGWGSRASHMGFLARYLSGFGFRTIAYDSPAHTSWGKDGIKDKSNMFEFCRALSTVVKKFAPIYGIVGHSLGAAAAAFTVSGFERLAQYKVDAEKIVLISTPFNVDSILRNYCTQHEKGLSIFSELKNALQEEFNFSTEEHSVAEALKKINSKILLVHDEEDEVFPVKEAVEIENQNPAVTLFTTHGSGHYKILLNRKMLSQVKDFVSSV